jgi:hypothetical protein
VWLPYLALINDYREFKRWRHDPNNGTGLISTTGQISEDNRPSHQVRVSAEPPLPKTMTHNYDVVFACLVFPRQEGSAQHRLDPKGSEEVGET